MAWKSYQLHRLFYAFGDVQRKAVYADLICGNGIT